MRQAPSERRDFGEKVDYYMTTARSLSTRLQASSVADDAR